MSDHADIDKHIRTYVLVFVALMALTAITVGISYLHLPIKKAIVLALIVALVKGSLVGAFFMHLISEKKAIYGTLLLTVIFFIAIMALPVSQFLDRIHL